MSVAVVGAGAWGTALSKHLSERGERVSLWCREPEVEASIRERRVNELFLPECGLPESIEPTCNLGEAVSGAELVVLAVPSSFLRSVAKRLDEPPSLGYVNAAKGLEEGSLLRMSEVLREVWGKGTPLAVLSGPSFAKEVAAGEPTALVAASRDGAFARAVQERLSTPRFRVYTNDDVVGVELGGSLKNVIALAVGVAAGLGLGHNPKAALMTRGLAEISRLAEAMGGRRETLLGLSGVGDLVLTCTGELSRNRTVGVALGRGERLDDILARMAQAVEGVRTTHVAVALAERHGVEMPIAVQMEQVLSGERTAGEAMAALLERPLRAE